MPPPKEGWQRSRVIALFATEALAREAATVLAAQDFFAECQVLGLADVPEQDWVRLTQSQFAPVEITPEFWIVPSWHEPPAQARQVIRLDPGLAFGTGTHPTTRMCLRWIATARRSCRTSACSTTAAARASWRSARRSSVRCDIDAVDIDEAAVESTRLNARGEQRRAEGRPARCGAGPLRHRAREHPRDAAQGAGAAAVRHMSRRAARWCWPASSSGRPTN